MKERRNGFYWVLTGWGAFETWQTAFYGDGIWTILGEKGLFWDKDFVAIGKRIKIPNHYPREA